MASQQIKSFDDFLILIGDNHLDVEKKGAPFSTSKVKLKILRALWEASGDFPRAWVKSSALLKLTGQKYFDRRIRELRDETGCDIETGVTDGKPAYRLCSTSLKKVQDRSYLATSQKKGLFDKFSYRCAVCGKQFNKGEKGLEADHRIPLLRGGGAEIENWQPLCVSCNVSKRRSCQGCEEECKKCGWAYPEKFGELITIRAPKETLDKIREVARRKGIHSQDFILEAVNLHVKKSS